MFGVQPNPTLFTFHYVSIKSTIHIVYYICLLEFTFHYVSIKSPVPLAMLMFGKLFTFHYVSIKSHITIDNSNKVIEFTFHYVSIKSWRSSCLMKWGLSFTFHYVSIKSVFGSGKTLDMTNLHSTMYLLNLGVSQRTRRFLRFTFHYVSIKSEFKDYYIHYSFIYIPLCIY